MLRPASLLGALLASASAFAAPVVPTSPPPRPPRSVLPTIVWPSPNRAFLEGKLFTDFIQPTAMGTPESGLFGNVRSEGYKFHEGLDIKPVELVQTLGVVLCATSLTLTFSLLFFGVLDGPRAVVSAAAVVPAIGGMWLGQQIRSRLSVDQFRLAVFWALLATGLYTVATRLL